MPHSLTTLRHRILRHVRPFAGARPKWAAIGSAEVTGNQPPTAGQRVLIATGTGSNWPLSGFESVLGAALQLRGAAIDVLLCDGALPACQECDLRVLPEVTLRRTGPRPLCGTCYPPARRMFQDMGVEPLRYSDHLTDAEMGEIRSFCETIADDDITSVRWRDIDVGEHAKAGALRYYGIGELSREPGSGNVARLYLAAAMRTVAMMDRLLASRSYDVAVFHHGIYVPQGVVADVCRRHGVRVVNWNLSYRAQTVIFSHDDTYHRTMIAETASDWDTGPLDAAQQTTLMDYLESRRSGGNDWISFQRDEGSGKKPLSGLGLDPALPTIGLLTNVMWDAQLHFRANAFGSMVDWIDFTIRHFAQRRDVQLVIRVHPAEVLGTVPSRQRVEDEIARRGINLPPNVRMVGPDDPQNTYALMKACDTALVYGTKMAIELPCWGIPVIVAGESWARGKGFTQDVSSAVEYGAALAALPHGKPLSDVEIAQAQRYAHYLFFRRMIPLSFARKNARLVPVVYELDSLDDLAAGADEGLDVICNGILNGSPFTCPR